MLAIVFFAGVVFGFFAAVGLAHLHVRELDEDFDYGLDADKALGAVTKDRADDQQVP